VICAGCGTDLGRLERVGRRDDCPCCHADLRACRHCRFHAPSLADGCREPQAERVADKTRANFCDYFAPAEAPPAVARPPVPRTRRSRVSSSPAEAA